MDENDYFRFFNALIEIQNQRSSIANNIVLEILNQQFSFESGIFYSYSSYSKKLIFRTQRGSTNKKVPSIIELNDIIIEDLFSRYSIGFMKNLEINLQTFLYKHFGKFENLFLMPLIDGYEVIDGSGYAKNYNYDLSKIGIIFLFLNSNDKLNNNLNFLQKITPLVSKFYASSTRVDKYIIRKLIVEKALLSKDLNSFLFKVLKLIRQEFEIEACSVFLWDDNNDLLRLHSSTGLTTNIPKPDIYYLPDDEDITLRIAKGKNLFLSDDFNTHYKLKYTEKVKGKIYSYLILPIPNWSLGDAFMTKPLGVFRGANKFNKENISAYSWEDISNLWLAVEIIGVITNLMKKSEQKFFEIERILHGSRANIEAIIQNLSHFEIRPNLIEYKNPSVNFIIPNSISHIVDLKWQIERLLKWQTEQIDPKTINKVLIFGDVLIPLISLCHKIANILNVPNFKITNLKDQGFNELPPTKGNAEALTTVFRNLFENAIKYSDPEKEVCEIFINYKIVGKYLFVIVQDNGIGIPLDREEWIFVEGFRAENAKRRRPAGGSGIGLSQSKNLMKQMEGDLQFSRENLTTFSVQIPLFD